MPLVFGQPNLGTPTESHQPPTGRPPWGDAHADVLLEAHLIRDDGVTTTSTPSISSAIGQLASGGAAPEA